MSVSIASFMCKCRTEHHTGSLSSNSASLSSIPPIVFVYLYLDEESDSAHFGGDERGSPVVHAVFDWQKIVDHRLVPEFV
jgi:hypothetical protein